MDKNKIIELEDFIFSVKEKPGVAARIMADIIGVLIGLKPAMIGDFSKNELKNMKVEKFEKIIAGLGLESVFFERHYYFNGKKKMIHEFCISKKVRLAEQTHVAFVELWSTMNDRGEILDQRKWAKVTKKIGRLLGYPRTAINDFTKDNAIENKDRIERMDRNRYYVHSAKYEDREFKMYDQKLNKAISNLTPKTTNLLTKNKKKRWLV